MRTHTSALTVACLVIALSACGGSDPESTATTTAPEPAGAEIRMAGFAYSGDDTVAVGETVTVTNEDAVGHTWTAEGGEFDSGIIAGGESFEHTFDESGEFEYFCSIHPQMTGTITVES
jgi:plastocyanin